MTIEEIDKIIAQGEGISIEFKKAKEKVPHSVYETVVSFANTRGGYISYFNGIMDLNNFNPHPKNPNMRKFFMALGWADEIGSGIRNTQKYLPRYVENAVPVFIDQPLFRTIIPLVRYTMADFTDEWFKWLDLDEKWRPKLTESLKNIEIDGQLHNMNWEEQISCLTSSWIEKVNELDKKNSLSSLEKLTKSEKYELAECQCDNKTNSLSPNEKVTKSDEGKRLSLIEKVTKLPSKKNQYYIVILLFSGNPISIDDLIEIFSFRDRSFFRKNYLKPLEAIFFIRKTNPEKPTASNQKYLITEQGKRFLTEN